MSRRVVSITLTSIASVALVVAFMIDATRLWPWVIPTASALVVGAVLTYKIPSNRVGWLLMVFGVGAGITGMFQVVAFEIRDPLIAGWFDAVGYSINTAAVVYSLTAILLRFPDGRLLNSRWRWAERLAIVTATVGGVAALLNGGWGGDSSQAAAPSPLAEVTAPVGDVLSAVFYVAMGAAFIVSATSVIVRYRRSRSDARLQMKWLTYSGVFMFLLFAGTGLSTATTGDLQLALEGWLAWMAAVAFAFIPVAIAIAIMRYRLYDIDLVISRTVVLALLAGFITAVYAVVVVFLGGLIGSESDGLLLPIVATAVVAVAFEPVRHTAQRWANRLVYGRRATPYEVLSDLTSRLSQGEQGEGLLTRMAERLGDGTGAERATIWLDSHGSMSVGASWPEDPPTGHALDLESAHVFEVTHDGATVGAFEVVKPRGTALSTAERSLITDLAGSAGAVLGYQRLNDSLAEKAVELAQSRARLVDAQDRERRRLERDLHDGAQQSIVGLKVKIGLAQTMATKHHATELEALLVGLADEAQGALDEVRALAKGIYPPVLESDGLGPAISALASGAGEEVLVDIDGIGRYERDVEAAIYFEISEAVTNAVKHAEGPIRVGLAETEGELHFSVSDSGPGFDVSSANGGSGLQNLKDRIDAVGGTIEIRSSRGEGTTVRGQIPLEEIRV
jgi:signal transduction histidine kinase